MSNKPNLEEIYDTSVGHSNQVQDLIIYARDLEREVNKLNQKLSDVRDAAINVLKDTAGDTERIFDVAFSKLCLLTGTLQFIVAYTEDIVTSIDGATSPDINVRQMVFDFFNLSYGNKLRVLRDMSIQLDSSDDETDLERFRKCLIIVRRTNRVKELNEAIKKYKST